MPRDRRPYILLPLAALIAVLPLILRGCSCGHDFDFHVINWLEAARQLTHGTLHPNWAFTPAWNAGEPRFVFYPPLSWIIGALLGLLMPWTWTPIAYTWLALTAAGLGLFHAARSFTTPNAALLAAAIYIVNPYTLFTSYERTAYAELLAAAWLPLLLGAVLRQRPTIPSIAIPLALLWMTNAPAAVMGSYALAFIALLRLALSFRPNIDLPRSQFTLRVFAGTLLGLALAAFYIVPAAYERRFVQIDFAILPGMDIASNFPFHSTTDHGHDAVLRTASIVAVLLIAITAIALLLIPCRARTSDVSPHETATTQFTLPLAILTLVIAFFLTPLSGSLWSHLPQLRFLQFPWRLTAILAATFALAVSLALSRLSLNSTRTISVSLLVALVLSFLAYDAFHQRCYPEDTVQTRVAVFGSTNPGSEPTDEYTPTGADNESLDDSNPGYWLTTALGTAAPIHSTPGPAPHQIDLNPTTPQILVLNLRDYPAWHITLNGAPITTRLHRDDGLIALPLTVGPAHIDITYATLPDQRLGYLISALSAVALIVLLRNGRAA
jgi:uncharacterized membrane protein